MIGHSVHVFLDICPFDCSNGPSECIVECSKLTLLLDKALDVLNIILQHTLKKFWYTNCPSPTFSSRVRGVVFLVGGWLDIKVWLKFVTLWSCTCSQKQTASLGHCGNPALCSTAMSPLVSGDIFSSLSLFIFGMFVLV